MRYHYGLYIACYTGLVIMFSACKPDIKPPVNNKNTPALAISSNQCFEVKTNWLEQASVNTYFNVDLRIKHTCVPAKAIGTLRFYADMPAHGHGTNNQPIIEKLAPLHYRIQGVLLHMPGQWRITLELPYQYAQQQQLEVINFNAVL